ncbi:MAG: hypothetical protein AAFV77_03240 [Planctomycetota bacterium]
MAATITRLGVPAKYVRDGSETDDLGVDVVVYLTDSALRSTGGSPERGRDRLDGRRRQGWELICLAGTHLNDEGGGVAADPELAADGIDPVSVVRLRKGDIFKVDGVYIGRDAGEMVSLRVPESIKITERSYWSTEIGGGV